MRTSKESFVIEQGGHGMTYHHHDGFTVYKLGRHPSYSVLAGQQRRQFIDRFETLAAAQLAHPTAVVLAGTSYQAPSLNHLPNDGDY
jgi:hypothetical protein